MLLCAGDVLIPSHYLTVFGFEDYLNRNRPDLTLHKVNGYHNDNEVREILCQLLREDGQLCGAFSVSARLSVLRGIRPLYEVQYVQNLVVLTAI